MGTNPSSEKDNGVKSSSVEFERFKDEPARIEAMTVQELGAALRSVGVPAKGCKRDLVNAFKCFVEKKIDVKTSWTAEEQASFSADNISVKCNVKDFSNGDCVEDVNTDLEVPGLIQHKGRVKKSAIEGSIIKFNTKRVTKKQNLSISCDEGSGRMVLEAKGKVSSKIVQEVVNADKGVMLVIQTEPWTVLAHKKPQKGWIPYNPKTMRPPTPTRDTRYMQLMSWNVNGFRALLKLEGFSALQLSQTEDFDVLCLQEAKLQEKDVENIKQCLIDGYENSFWSCSVSKLGYSGTAIISRVKPLSVRFGLDISDHDSEGRLVMAEFDSFYLLSGYVPNSGDGLRRLGNKRSDGFTDEERQSFGMNSCQGDLWTPLDGNTRVSLAILTGVISMVATKLTKVWLQEWTLGTVIGDKSETPLIFFAPQVFRFGLFPCPRHRRFDSKTGLLTGTNDGTLVNFTLRLLGRMSENLLCIVLLVFQMRGGNVKELVFRLQ